MPRDTGLTTPEKIVTYIGASAAAFDKANEAMQKRAAYEKEAAQLIPDVVQTMIDNDRLDEGMRKDAEEALKDPIKALKILKRAAAHRNVAEKASLGKHEVEKSASARGPSPHVGRRVADPENSESYRALSKGLGLTY